MKIKLSFFVLAMCMCLHCSAQSISKARSLYNEFDLQLKTGGESMKAYSALNRCYQECFAVMNASSEGSSEWVQSKELLLEIMPHVRNGAYFYTSRNDSDNTIKFATYYVDITIHSAFKAEAFELAEDYGTFAWMAATQVYNKKNYAQAIPYLDAYINSDDTKLKAEAYSYMAKCYIYLDDTDYAKFVLEQGLKFFPDNLSMLSSIINLLGESKNDDVALQKYVSSALRMKPKEEGLINIQAQLYERTGDYDKAIEWYGKLKIIKPHSLEVARHLAINNYNSGVVYVNAARKMKVTGERKNKKEIKHLEETARVYFSRASKILNELLFNEPYAINYAYALANAYYFLGDKANLESVNEKIMALNHEPVVSVADIEVMDYDRFVTKATLAHKQPLKKNPVEKEPRREVARYSSQLTSDVDINIPLNATTNENSFVMIVANEKYTNVAPVPNAEHDGNIFAEYCNKVLGIPKDNIRKHLNVTFAGLLTAVDDITKIAKAKKGDCNIIVYYAGHGIPDEETGNAYILPVDADGKTIRACYSLNELYRELSAMNANCTAVFIDACFSGATRNNGEMLMSARSIAIEVDESEIDGRLVVFSAASGDQTALSYDEKHHGMFTYYLLNKLQETKGNVTFAELGEYITEKVSLQSQLKNKKEQTPTVVIGSDFGPEWKMLKLR